MDSERVKTVLFKKEGGDFALLQDAESVADADRAIRQERFRTNFIELVFLKRVLRIRNFSNEFVKFIKGSIDVLVGDDLNFSSSFDGYSFL